MPMLKRQAALCGVTLLAFAMPFAVQAADKARDAILILDASGSMWGQIGSDTKMSMAKKAVEGIVDRWPDGGGLGLMAYGHRTKGDCNDIEMLAPLGALDKSSLKGMVSALQPRGKTPLSASLMQAAAALKGNEDGATVILVSDGIESCNADPCAIAAQLKKDDVKLVAHVIGFDVTDPAAKQQLACIATSTGGVYLDAKDASGLESALNKASQAAQGEKVKTEAPKKPKKEAVSEFNVQGVMRLSEDSDPLTDADPSWRFYATGSDAEGKGELLSDKVTYGSKLEQTLPPGDYMLEVSFGAARKLLPVTVKEGEPLKLDVSLEAGFVTSVASVEGAGETKDLTWEIYKKSMVEGEKGERLDTKYDTVPRFVIPAGDYTMRLSKENSETVKEFKLEAGDSINLDMSLNIGRVMAKALYAPGGPQAEKNLAYSIYKGTNSIEGGESVRIDTKYDNEPNFGVPAGKYDMVVEVGLVNVKQPFEVKSGEATKLEIVLNAGVLGWKGEPTESIEIREAKTDINGERKRLTTNYDDEGNIAVPVGDYLLVAAFADANTREFPFSIKAGERTEVTIAP